MIKDHHINTRRKLYKIINLTGRKILFLIFEGSDRNYEDFATLAMYNNDDTMIDAQILQNCPYCPKIEIRLVRMDGWIQKCC